MHAPTHAVSQQRSRRAQEHWRREHTQPADPHVCVGDSSADEALCAIYSARMPPHPYRFREEEKGTENFRAHQSYAWLKLLRPVRESADPCTLRVFFSVCINARSVSIPQSCHSNNGCCGIERVGQKTSSWNGFGHYTSRNRRSPAPRSIRGIRQTSKTRDCVFSGHRPTPFRRNSARALARRSLQNGRQRPGGLRDAAAGAAEAARPRELLVALDEEE